MKLTDDGVAVINGDTHISQWVIDSRTLKIAEPMLTPFRKYIPLDGVVLDIGASIGVHTITYAEWVGADGVVAAFEINPEAYKCLEYNLRMYPQVVPTLAGASDVNGSLSLIILDNAGASYLTDAKGPATVTPIDYYEFDNVNFIKMDIEGYEVKALKGALKTINSCRPTMLIEVNRFALERAGSSPEELKLLIKQLDYSVTITDYLLSWSNPQFDIICLPNEKAH